MIQIESKEGNKRKCVLTKTDGDDRTVLIDFSLKNHAVSNNFDVVSGVIGEMCETIDGFEDWFERMIINYTQSNHDPEIIISNIPTLKEYAEEYVNSKNIVFDDFVNMDKKSNTSIVFNAEDLRAIALTSTASKLYSVISCDTSIHLPDNLHRKVYEMIIQPCIDKEVTIKIFQLIRSRTYRSSITDRYMWDFIKMMISETPESYVMTVFNFLMKSMITLLDITQNPVPYLISTVDDSIRWLMKNVYKDKIVYGEVFGGVEDLFGSSLTKENFYLFCCHDTIGRAAKVGMDVLEKNYGLEGRQFEEALSRFDDITQLYPASLLVTLPIVSKVLEIPYRFLLTIPPKHAVLLGILMHDLAKDVMDDTYPVLTEFLLTCPAPDGSDENGKGSNKSKYNNTSKSLYRIRNAEFVLNDSNSIFGFPSKVFKYDIMSLICGILSASKRGLVLTHNGKSLSKMTYYGLESDVCGFYSKLYSNSLEPIFKQMRTKSEEYF